MLYAYFSKFPTSIADIRKERSAPVSDILCWNKSINEWAHTIQHGFNYNDAHPTEVTLRDTRSWAALRCLH